jgi:asparagine synthase (glutamine-hydrolysing)
VLAALLDREGLDGLARVEGSYAFAFWKAPDGPLWLGRDPHGVRPLAWARTTNGLVFASTLDGLLATGLVEPVADPTAVSDVLRDGVVLGARSALVGVERIDPGEVLRFDERLRLWRHAVPPRRRDPDPEPQTDPATAVLDAIRDAVLERLRLERPAGVLLSGGIDSALVASFARESPGLVAWTLAFPRHPEADEAPRARRTAQRLGLPHVEVPLPGDPTAWVLGAARAFDEPFADASAVPLWGLGKAASGHVRAVLTGTGGDEVFGGYRRYWLLGTGPWLRHVPRLLREPVASLLERAAPPGARLLRAAADPEGLYRGLMRLQAPDDLERLVGTVTRVAPEAEPVAGPRTALEAMNDDRRRYLPWDLLVKEDRALMAHAIEGRHPFLDARVLAAATRLERRGGPGRRRQKAVLRAYVREVVDPDLSRVAKHGFAFPCDALYGGPLSGLAEDVLLSRRALERGFTDPEETRRILRDHLTGERPRGAVVHALVMLELWARRTLDRHPVG